MRIHTHAHTQTLQGAPARLQHMGTTLQAFFYVLAQLQKCPSVFAYAAPEKVSKKQLGKKKTLTTPKSLPHALVTLLLPLPSQPDKKKNPTKTNRHKQECVLLPAVTQDEDLATLWVCEGPSEDVCWVSMATAAKEHSTFLHRSV